MLDRRFPWIAGYVFLALVPGALTMLVGAPEWRGVWIELAVAGGFVGLALFVLQFVSTGRFPRMLGPLGMDETMRLHRWTGIAATLLVLAHPVVLIVQRPGYVAFFDPRVNALRALALIAAVGALIVVGFGPFVKRKLKLDHGWWRLTHGVLALMLVAIGAVHVLQVGHFTDSTLERGMWIALALVALNLWMEARVFKPLRRRKTPWRVSSVTALCDRTWALVVEAEGHAGLELRAGQFAWLTLGDSVFSLEHHPFSISSSAKEQRRIEFAIKELGDYTANIGKTVPGTRAFVEGPYGAFELPSGGAPLILVAGGIGIAPMIGLLRTLHDNGDKREIVLFVGTENLVKAAYKDDIEKLRAALNLRVVRVLEKPPADWSGEVGYIDVALLRRHLEPALLERAHAFLCGPTPMMHAVEAALRSIGLPKKRIQGERFDIF